MTAIVTCRKLHTTALAAALLACEASFSEEPVSHHQNKLAEYDLTPTTASIADYLNSLRPSPAQKRRIAERVQELGHAEYARREAAMRDLVRQPTGVSGLLEEAVAGDDPEIRWRAKQILDRTERESRSLLHAVLTTIEHEKLAGLCNSLLESAPFCREGYLQSALARALAATSTEADAPQLRAALNSPDRQIRIVALTTLAKLLGKRAEDDALRLLADDDERVQSTAARALAGTGRRESLAVLVRLLESSEMSVRLEAYRTLRALTGETFGYTGYDTPEKRTAAVALWKQWLAEKSATAALKLPLRDLPVDLGRLLVCDHSSNRIVEYDTNGLITWQRQAPLQPWACQGLPNGHRLVGSYNERSVVEYDADGTEIWKVESLPGGPTSVERLDNGNTLIACTEGQQVVEVDAAKKIVWKVTLEGRPVDARRLEDGRTLVALQNAQKIVEVDPEGKVVWEIGDVGLAFSAQRLPDGNTLVCSLNTPEVREFDTAGKVVWSQGSFSNAYTAQRLADGNTIVVDRAGVTEIDPKGTTVRRIGLPNVSRAWRY